VTEKSVKLFSFGSVNTHHTLVPELLLLASSVANYLTRDARKLVGKKLSHFFPQHVLMIPWDMPSFFQLMARYLDVYRVY
jgi:hypothetical protein